MGTSVDASVRQRLDELIAEGNGLTTRFAQKDRASVVEASAAVGWMTAVLNVVEMICPLLSAYRTKAATIVNTPRIDEYRTLKAACEMLAVAMNLKKDADLGLIGNIEDRAAGIAFDDFLLHAEEYVAVGRHQEAGVIAGVVFEDTVKRIAKKRGATDTSGKVDQIIGYLSREGVISKVTASRARTAAAVRTESTHANWSNFSLDDVKATITFTRELISKHLDIA